MSEMGDWINQMFSSGVMTRPGGEGPWDVPVPTTPLVDTLPSDAIAEKPSVTPVADAPAYPGAPPWAGDPSIPAPLEMFLRQYYSGHSQLPQEIYDLYGGDNIIQQLQQYDPNASWTYGDMGGGEGAMQRMGYSLNFDPRTLPAPAGPLGWSRPTNAEGQGLTHGDMKYYDPIYGWVTDPRNVARQSNTLETLAPYIAAGITMGGPAIGGALAGAGIGAGGTAAVTGGAAGLNAANIATGGAPSWWSNLLGKAPRTVGPIVSGAPSQPTTYRPSAPSPAAVTTPKRGAPLARNQVMPDSYGFDPAAFNSGGSTTKPQSNDSRLVATQFADDPYRFS